MSDPKIFEQIEWKTYVSWDGDLKMFENSVMKLLGEEKREDFVVEFFGYNFTPFGSTKKIYIKPSFVKRVKHDKDIVLDYEKMTFLLDSLDAEELKAFGTDRYSLYDISFRWSDCVESIGFSFKDYNDSIFLSPEKVFEPFKNIGMNHIVTIVKRIEKIIFPEQPVFNPISMIAVVIDKGKMICLKAYIRYDKEKIATSLERLSIMEKIVKIFVVKKLDEERLLLFSRRLERIGFVFSFIGVDCYKNEDERFKLYFQLCGRKENKVYDEIISLLSDCKLDHNDLQRILKKQENGIWGIAISVGRMDVIDGIQLYFYP